MPVPVPVPRRSESYDPDGKCDTDEDDRVLEMISILLRGALGHGGIILVLNGAIIVMLVMMMMMMMILDQTCRIRSLV